MRPYYEASGITLYHGDCRDVLAWKRWQDEMYELVEQLRAEDEDA